MAAIVDAKPLPRAAQCLSKKILNNFSVIVAIWI